MLVQELWLWWRVANQHLNWRMHLAPDDSRILLQQVWDDDQWLQHEFFLCVNVTDVKITLIFDTFDCFHDSPGRNEGFHEDCDPATALAIAPNCVFAWFASDDERAKLSCGWDSSYYTLLKITLVSSGCADVFEWRTSQGNFCWITRNILGSFTGDSA